MSNTRTTKPRKEADSEVVRRARTIMVQADAAIQRMQRQVHNQVGSISRLLKDRDAAAEISRLQERIADLEQWLADIAGNGDAKAPDTWSTAELRAMAREALERTYVVSDVPWVEPA